MTKRLQKPTYSQNGTKLSLIPLQIEIEIKIGIEIGIDSET